MDIASGIAAASSALGTLRQLAEIDKALSLGELKLKTASLYSDLADVKIALSDAREAMAAKDRRIAELEAAASRAPGAACPACGAYCFRVTMTEPNRRFGRLGGKDVTRTCEACGFTDVELVTPKG